jgi:hypothetical protein
LPKLQLIASTIALLLICVPLTIGTVWAFPVYDDAWFWLLLREQGVDAIRPSLADRPIWANLLLFLARAPNTFWFIALAAQAVLWPMLGLLAALLWQRLFPDLRRFAFVVACLTIAPLFSKIQLMTGAQFVLGPLLSVVLAYGALLLLLFFLESEGQPKVVILALSLMLLACAVLLTEYAIPVAISGLVLAGAHIRWVRGRGIPVRILTALGLWLVVTCLIYVLYVIIADHTIRANVSPLYALTLGRTHLRMPVRILASLWQLFFGSVAAAMVITPFSTQLNIAATLYAAIVAGLLVYGSRSAKKGSVIPNTIIDRSVFVLLAALIMGGLPIMLMGRRPWDLGVDSRFGVPLLPLAAVLTIRVAIGVVQRRYWWMPVLLYSFVAGHVVVTDTWVAVQERRLFNDLGAVVAPYVVGQQGYTVVVVDLPDRPLGRRRPWELTARLTADWPESTSSHVWAYPPGQAYDLFGPRFACKLPTLIDTTTRMVNRKGPLSQVVWLSIDPDQNISIEQYCTLPLPAPPDQS